MICENLYFECATIINLIIASIIGFFLSISAAYFYEKFTNKRNQNKFSKQYKFLESEDNKFDWQHWNIKNYQIADNPIPTFMRMIYLKNKTFSFQWIESENGRIEGKGKFIFEDEIYGTLHFFSINSIHYYRRNFYYLRKKNNDIWYDAIFINADDQNYEYVLMRKSSSQIDVPSVRT